jgi:hypothetical protein
MIDCSQITDVFKTYPKIFTDEFFKKLDDMIMNENTEKIRSICEEEENNFFTPVSFHVKILYEPRFTKKYMNIKKNMNINKILKKEQTLSKDETIYLFFYLSNIRSLFHRSESPYVEINIKLQEISDNIFEYFVKNHQSENEQEQEESELEEIEKTFSVKKGNIVEKFYNRLKIITIESPTLNRNSHSKNSWKIKKIQKSPSIQSVKSWFSHKIRPYVSPKNSNVNSKEPSKEGSTNTPIQKEEPKTAPNTPSTGESNIIILRCRNNKYCCMM